MDDGIGYDVVAATDSQMEADLIVDQLESTGVTVLQMPRSQYPESSSFFAREVEGEILILVPRSCASYARSLLDGCHQESWGNDYGASAF